MNSTQTSKTIQIIRFSRLLLHIFSGLFQSIAYPYFSRSRQRYIARKWARNLLEILNIKLSRSGALPPENKQRVILIANHISWLDIIIILALYPVRFVAKTEILSWPLLNILWHRETVNGPAD